MNSNAPTFTARDQVTQLSRMTNNGNARFHPGGTAADSAQQVPFISGLPSKVSSIRFMSTVQTDNQGNAPAQTKLRSGWSTQVNAPAVFSPSYNAYFTKLSLPINLRTAGPIAGVVKL